MRAIRSGLLCLAVLGGVATGPAPGQGNGAEPETLPVGGSGIAPIDMVANPRAIDVDAAMTASRDRLEKSARSAVADAPADTATKDPAPAQVAAPDATAVAGPDEAPASVPPGGSDKTASADSSHGAAIASVQSDHSPRDDASIAYEQGLALSEGRDGPADPEGAARAYLQAALTGHAGAQFELGWAFETGQGVMQSDIRARYWYARAVAGGDPRAMNNLGWLHAHGRGGDRDEARAADLYRAAANAGEVSAMANLGWLMENGIGMAQDLESAAALYAQAANAGDTQSMLNLGNLYLVGDGVGRDPARALVWFARARSAGRAEALSYIAEVFENSPELRDTGRAAMFYIRALEAGDSWPMARAAASWDDATAKALQRILAGRALYAGPIDGQIGSGSRRAMRAVLDDAAAR